jgi:hypothetical protein
LSAHGFSETFAVKWRQNVPIRSRLPAAFAALRYEIKRFSGKNLPMSDLSGRTSLR